MKVLFRKILKSEHPTLVDGIAEQLRSDSLEDVCERIDVELTQRIVWAKVFGYDEHKFIVRDVRILTEDMPTETPNVWVVTERIQVLLLEGWQTARLIWTDELEVEDEWPEELPRPD